MDIFKDNNTTKETITPSKEDQIRQMGGHDGSIDKAIDIAPDDTGIAIPSVSQSTTRKSRKPKSFGPQPVAQTVTPIKTAAEIEAERKRQDAIKKIQSEMAKDVAGLPYEAWAFIAQDNTKALSKEEEKELSDAYALVAETLPLGNMNPVWTSILFICSRNAKFIRARLPKDSPEMQDIKNALRPSK